MMSKIPALAIALILLISSTAQAAGLEFLNYDDGLKKATEEKKDVMIFFWADWCRYCTMIKNEVFTKDDVKNVFEQSFVAVSVNIDKDPQAKELSKKYKSSALPTLTFIDSTGDMKAYWEGAADVETFYKILNFVKNKK